MTQSNRIYAVGGGGNNPRKQASEKSSAAAPMAMREGRKGKATREGRSGSAGNERQRQQLSCNERGPYGSVRGYVASAKGPGDDAGDGRPKKVDDRDRNNSRSAAQRNADTTSSSVGAVNQAPRSTGLSVRCPPH